MRPAVIFFTAIAVLGTAIYLAPKSPIDSSSPSDSQPTQIASQSDSADRPSPTVVNDYRPAPSTSAPTSVVKPMLMQSLKSVVPVTTANNRRVCAAFAIPLATADFDSLSRFVRFEPEQEGIQVSIESGELCVTGEALKEPHRITLLPGAALSSGSKLRSAIEFIAHAEDLPSHLAFGSGNHILARNAASGLELTVTNVPEVDIEIIRVPERAALEVLDDIYAGQTAFREYEVESILEDAGVLVWKGTLTGSKALNAPTPLIVPIQNVLEQQPTGLFLVFAAAPEDTSAVLPSTVFDADADIGWRDLAVAQWVVLTNVGVSASLHNEGMLVSVKRLDTAEPIHQAQVTLVTRNNDLVFEALTTTDGIVQVPSAAIRGQRADAPSHLVVQNGTDVSYLRLDGASLDLSDYPVEGRQPKSGVDAYVFTDRGIYRPGGTIQVTGVLRDTYGRRIAVPDSSIRLRRPDGIIVRDDSLTRDDLDGFSHRFTLPQSSARGLWTVEIYSPESDDQVFGSVSIDVQDFVPERLALELKAPNPTQLMSEFTKIEGTAAFLYGAPASDLVATAHERLAPMSKQAATQLGLNGFAFGDALNPWQGSTRQVLENKTSDKGEISALVTDRKIQFPTIGSRESAYQPLRSVVDVEILEPGGRPTLGSISQILIPQRFIGLRTPEKIEIGSAFEIIVTYLNDKLEPVNGAELNWDVREISSNWFYDKDSKQWEVQERLSTEPMASGTLEKSLDSSKGHVIPIPSLDWGRYAITVHAPASRSYNRQVVDVGWSGKPRGDRPDFMPVMAKSSSFQPGEPLVVFVDAPFDGVVSMSIWTDSLVHHQSYPLRKGKNTLRVPTESSWFPGAYVTLQALRPLASGDSSTSLSADRYIPARLFGTIYLKAEHDRRLDIILDHKPIKASRQNIPFEIAIENLRNKKAYVVIQAVDLGILNLTDFQTPDPMGYFEAKPALQTRFYDDYNKLIRADGQITEIRSGAGVSASLGGPSLGVTPTKSIALYSGVVEVDSDGKATVNIEIPDFNGTLRTTAVAWSDESFGSTTKDIVLSDPVVAEAILPRYLAPGDSSEITLLLANTSESAITTNVVLSSGKQLEIGEDAISSELNPGERKTLQIPVVATLEGQTYFGLRLESSDGFTVEREWGLTVRYAGDGPTIVLPKETLAPGATLDLKPTIHALGASNTESGYISVDGEQGLPLASAVKTLLSYPWTCSEQTTSKARPILQAYAVDPDYVTRVSSAVLQGQKPADWIQENVDRILERQGSDGSVGLWRRGDGLVDPLLSARIAGFLADAYRNGFDISKDAALRTANWSHNLILDWRADANQVRYALSVLIKGVAPMNQSNLRLARSYADYIDESSVATKLNFAVALNNLGDSKRASELTEDAANTPNNRTSSKVYYWREILDTLEQAEDYFALGVTDRANDLLRSASMEIDSAEYLSVTTAAAITKAMVARAQIGSEMSVALDGESHTSKLGGLLIPLNAERIASKSPIELISHSNQNLDISVVLETIPSPGELLIASTNGLRVKQKIFDEAGRPIANPVIDASVNSRFVIVSEVVAEKDLGQSQILFQHPVAAGFQVDKIITPSLRTDAYGWLPELSYVDVIEARDDGVVAAQLDRIDKGDVVMRVAYIIRATTPGEYLSLQSIAQDMYDASIFGVTDGQPVTVRDTQ